MMKHLWLLLALSACSEYGFDSPNEDKFFGHGNSIPLECTEQIDSFYEPAPIPVDILFAIDQSCSMIDNQNNLNSNLPIFLGLLNNYNIDYRIGVTSTDNSGAVVGKLGEFLGVKWITPYTPYQSEVFQALSQLAVGPGEAGIDAVHGALIYRWHENASFFRREAPLHIITISDEKDHSIYRTPRELVQLLQDLEVTKGVPVTYSAIVNVPQFWSLCEIYDPINQLGLAYTSVALQTRGVVLDICMDNWSNAMEVLAEHATPEPRFEYLLSRMPLLDTLSVEIVEGGNTVVIPFYDENNPVESLVGHWVYDPVRNSIELTEFEASENSTVIINYCLNDGSYLGEEQ